MASSSAGTGTTTPSAGAFWKSREARIRGCLYEGPGFPLLKVPDKDILACGTADPLADVVTQARLSDQVASIPRKRHSGRLGHRVRGAAPLRRP